MKFKFKKTIILSALVVTLAVLAVLLFINGLFRNSEAYASSGTDFVIEKNPIESVEILSDKNAQLKVGESVKLSCNVYPAAANETVENISYKLNRGESYATLDGDILTVNNTAQLGAVIEVSAVVDDVVSGNSLVFTVVKTSVESIEIIAPRETIYQGAVMHLSANVFPQDASNKNVVYSIVQGEEYAEINFKGTIAVIKNLPAGDLNITVRAASESDPAVYAERQFALYKPVIGISSANTDLKFVEQKRSYSFMANAEPYNATFGDSNVTYSLNVDESVATISEEGLLYITENAPIGQSITVHIEATDGIYFEQTVTVVPVYAAGFSIKNYTAPNEGNSFLPDSVINFDVEFFGADNISECNKLYSVNLSDDKFAYLEDNAVKIKSINEISDINPSFKVTLSTVQDGVLLSEEVEICIYIPVVSIILTPKTEQVYENTVYSLDDLFNVNINPLNSTARFASYEITVGSDIAYIDGDKLVVTDNVPSGDLQIIIKATAYNQDAKLIFNVYKPTDTLSIIANNYEPVSAKAYGEKVLLTSYTSEKATANNPQIRILQGADNISGNYKNGDLLDGTEFELKSNLAYQANLYPLIVLEGEQDGVTCLIEIEIYIPNEGLVLSTSGGTLNRGIMTSFFVSNTPNASQNGFELVGEKDSNIEDIDLTGHTIKIKQDVSAGTKIIVNYRSTDKIRTQFTSVFTVSEIISSGTNFGVLYSDSSKVYTSNWLYAIIGNDSAGIAISKNYQQLYTGRQTTINLNFGGQLLSDFGLSLQNVVPSSSNITISNIGKDYFTVKVNSSASGLPSSNVIEFVISLVDGEKVYKYTLSPLKVFREMTGTPVLTGNATIYNATTNFGLSIGTFDINATKTLMDLQFSCSESGKGVSITSGGKLTISENCTAENISIKVSCVQNYNNTTITYSKTFSRKVRWITVKDTLRNTETKILGVESYTSKISSPGYGNYKFGGYYTSACGAGTCYYDASGNLKVSHSTYNSYTTLYAKWTYAYKEYHDDTLVYNSTRVWDQTYTCSVSDTNNFQGWTLNDGPYNANLSFTYTRLDLNSEGVAVIKAVYSHDGGSSCVVQGTLITLADGTEKAVEDLDGTEQVLAWDFRTGNFVSTTVMFVVNHGENDYEVVNMYFSDGTVVGVIYEHGFFDYNLNKYVFLRSDADKYIGHYFNKQYIDESGNLAYKKVQLTDVKVDIETTVSYSPVTSQYLCYYVNGMLSVSAETNAFVNMFEFDGENMVYASTVADDIALYGLFTYDDFKEYVPEEMFVGFNAQYLKISIGKGLITWEELLKLINCYSEYLLG